ncbi:MAG: Spi family protease inhibitor, partial [Alphaproteobacteria bacterium]|nr:Spi family protease inhibitor [Alphaproteobacteria bacterium]
MKKLLVIALMMLVTQLQAQVRIGYAEAYSTAEKFVSQQEKQANQSLALSEEIKSKQTGRTNLFVFSIEPKGYVIVSALNDVLAYS